MPLMQKIYKTILFFLAVSWLSWILLFDLKGIAPLRSVLKTNPNLSRLDTAADIGVNLLKPHQLPMASDLLESAYISHKLKPIDIEVVNLNIDNDDLRFLENNLPPKYHSGVLTDEYKKRVDAQLVVNNITYPVTARFRGALYNHWSREKKSWDIEFDKKSPNGWEELVLILPEDRGFYVEALSQYRAQKLGLESVDWEYVWLKVNNKNHGIYFAQTEQLGGTGAQDKFSDSDKLRQTSDLFESTQMWSIGGKQKDKAEKVLKKFVAQEFSESLDEEKWLKWNVHNVLFASTHQDWRHNLRLLYDKKSNKFELVPTDLSTEIGVVLNERKCNSLDFDTSPLSVAIVTDQSLKLKRDQMLWEYVKDGRNLKDDIGFWDELRRQTRDEIYKDRLKYPSNYVFDGLVFIYRKNLVDQYNLIYTLLSETDASVEIAETNNGAKIRIVNSGFPAIYIESINTQKVDEYLSAKFIDDKQRHLECLNPIHNSLEMEISCVECNKEEIEIRAYNAVTGKAIEVL